MKTTRLLAAAVLVLGSGVAPLAAQAPLPGTTRTDLQRHDLSAPGREVIQVRVDIGPGVTAPRHSHPGEEIVYGLEGLLEYRVEGKPPVILKAGEVLFIPAAQAHASGHAGIDSHRDQAKVRPSFAQRCLSTEKKCKWMR
jgi:quercetin dioxygenase-like cupin family protein